MNSMVTVDASQIDSAGEQLRAGALVGLPTETVYGLAADACSDDAVARIFAAKGRPSFNPLIVHVSGLDHAKKLVAFTPLAEGLSHAFWPGPLTLVLPRRPDCPASLLASAGLDTLAVRAPNHPIAEALLKQSGLALAAPSANRSGTISPTRAEHVAAGMGDAVSLILDGGPCVHGVESTIVRPLDNEIVILRPGSITAEMLETFAPVRWHQDGDGISAPGQLTSHYAPEAPLRLNATGFEPDEAVLSFGPCDHPVQFPLSPQGDLVEAAANLFAQLRAADASGAKAIAAMPIPAEGLGVAINDRLTRAAAPRGV